MYQMHLKNLSSRLKRDLELSRGENFLSPPNSFEFTWWEKVDGQKNTEFLVRTRYDKNSNKNNMLSLFIASQNQESAILAFNKMKQFGIDANSGVVNFGQ
ncbi:hypothetical protein Glove_66g16 [Diversispora epigaea]|uniref:Uncharacterized protein n=1 Tax=Diversispora epigaea TaxID=1348612 RepID=A0A397JCR6_9GLOM|nr:hypothetical protein Glove_66g16 [Diversispora epigaea]